MNEHPQEENDHLSVRTGKKSFKRQDSLSLFLSFFFFNAPSEMDLIIPFIQSSFLKIKYI